MKTPNQIKTPNLFFKRLKLRELCLEGLTEFTKVDETAAGHLKIPLLEYPPSGWKEPEGADRGDWNTIILSSVNSDLGSRRL